MSGIVGIVNLDGAPVDRELLTRMTDFMSYRGPDEQKTWVDGNVGLGQTMLRTTFEAETEHQPLTLDGKVWLTADARIDGRAELITELEGKLGTTLRVEDRSNGSGSRLPNDAELILYAYRAWGQDCVSHLIGDFAFAIWDSKRRRLFCVRDHFGFKPFYYAHIGNTFIFSNTLNCIRQHPNVSGELNDLAVADFLIFGFNQEPATTTFTDVQRLPPGHRLLICEGAFEVDRYWRLAHDSSIHYNNQADYLDQFKQLLKEAISDRVRTDSLGLKMSGGVDSTTIAALTSELRQERNVPSELRAYTAVYDYLIPDHERHYSCLAAQALGIPIEYFPADRYKPFERWDEPDLRTPEPVEQLFSALPHDIDNKVVLQTRVLLGGLGGDCLRLSLRSYLQDRLRKREFKSLLNEYGRYVAEFWKRPPLNLSRSLKLRLGLTQYPKGESFPGWLNPDFVERLDLKTRWQSVQTSAYAGDSLSELSYETFMSNAWASEFESSDPGLTRKTVEYRQPLFDLRLVEYSISIPPVPYWLDKMLLRTSTKGTLPNSVRLRPKAVLGGNPLLEYLKGGEAERLNHFKPAPNLDRYLFVDRVPFIGSKGYNVDDAEFHAYYQHLRPKAFNHWLGQEGRT